MINQDDRTEEQRQTHTWLVIGTDSFMSFMSGWGGAEGGLSYAAWACKPEDADTVYQWVSARSDMKRVRETSANGYQARGAVHCHIYVVHENHVALGGVR